jgi:hypothetical protein
MDRKSDILRRIQQRMEEDEDYAEQLGDAVESNDWDWVESLIKSVLDIAISFAKEFIEVLVRSIFG